MKVIHLNEVRTNLEQYAQECQVSPVIVTVDGKPAFETLPVRSDDTDFIDHLIEENDAFRELLERRRGEADVGHVSSLDEVRRRLG